MIPKEAQAKEFNLSEKIKQNFFNENYDGSIKVKDIKEFIKKLKDYMINQNTKDFIDKLAGSDLI